MQYVAFCLFVCLFVCLFARWTLNTNQSINQLFLLLFWVFLGGGTQGLPGRTQSSNDSVHPQHIKNSWSIIQRFNFKYIAAAG